MAFNIKHNILSKKAEELGINNFPGVDKEKDPCLTYDFIVNNLNLLHWHCIRPILEEFPQDDIMIKSAYRSLALNAAITGKHNETFSQHVRGYAVDIVSKTYPPSLIWNWCYQNLPSWNQLIWEYPERGHLHPTRTSWVHISWISGNNPKTTSVSSKREDIHEMYKKEQTIRKGDYTHNIPYAHENLI